MCGIVGLLHSDPGRPATPAAVEAMVRVLDHRGPDDRGVFVDGPVGLGHARLSVIDLSTAGHQPMRTPDGRHALVYNGEVYNYRELRRELEQRGRTFTSRSDTEVVLQTLVEYGSEGVARLEGMFAFAFWDHARSTLLLARDRLGIKPLFYVADGDGVAFASEPKALPGRWRGGRPAPARIAEYLAFRHLAGEDSLEPAVRTLAPGHWLELQGDRRRLVRYWSPRPGGAVDRGETLEVIRGAVQRQLVSDVPVGIFLSGGVDSSLVTAAATASRDAVDSFTVGFSEAGWDESSRARVVADHCRTRAHVVTLDPSRYPEGMLRAIWHLDAPLNHAHSPHLLELSRVARQTVTVALTGEGGDELFGGYPRYRLLLASRALRAAPAPILGLLAKALRSQRPRLARVLDAAAADSAHAVSINAAFVPLDDAAALAGLDRTEDLLLPRVALAREALAHGENLVDALLSLERQTYLVSLLQRMDRLSMAVGLECRVPLLDERVVDHALSIPAREKLTLRDSKIPLRRESSRIFGRDYAYAPKSGFGVPLDAWFRGDGPLARMLGRVLEQDLTRRRGLFDTALAQRFLAEHRSGGRDRTEALWGLLNLELWARMAQDGRAPGDAIEGA